mgnify:FL=1
MKRLNRDVMKRINDDIENYIQDTKLVNYQESNDQKEGFIFLDLKNVSIYNEYSGEAILDEGIFHFIDETYKFVKKKVFLKLIISFPEEMSAEERLKIQGLIKVHYAVAYKHAKHEIAKTKILAWILLGIGALLFLWYGLLDWYNVNFVFRGIIEIFSWVFIWESCNLFVFTNSENRMEMVKYLRLFDAV